MTAAHPVSRAPAPAPDASCTDCGTSIPAGDTICAVCHLKTASKEISVRTLLLHWLVFIAGMIVVFGGGWLLAP